LEETEYDQVFGRRTLSGRIEDDRHTSGACKFAEFAVWNGGKRERRSQAEKVREIIIIIIIIIRGHQRWKFK
jgi:hypothetical protein